MNKRARYRSKAIAATAAGLAAALLLAACSSDAAEAPSAADSAEAKLLAKYDVSIPDATVNLAMMPFADNMVMAIPTANDWFKDAGITVGPEKFTTVDLSQQVALTLNGTYDVTSNYGPGLVSGYDGAPNIKMFGLVDDNSGMSILASPDSGADTVSDLVDSGEDFETAATEVMAQLKGKRFATDDTGNHRAFVDTLFSVGGITTDDLGDLFSLSDAKMLALAEGGGTDFAIPDGNAQAATLISKGWKQIFTENDLVKGLPAGDPRAVAGLGNEGLSTTQEYYDANTDTILRLAGVLYRTLDAIKADVAAGTTEDIAKVVPVLNSAAGLNLTPEEVASVYENIDPMLSFEEQEKYFVDDTSPFYYRAIYDTQFSAAHEAGIVKSSETNGEDIFGPAAEVYKAMVGYKTDYEDLLASASDLSGDQAKLAAIAKKKYDQRDYLDAARIMKAATS